MDHDERSDDDLNIDLDNRDSGEAGESDDNLEIEIPELSEVILIHIRQIHSYIYIYIHIYILRALYITSIIIFFLS